MAKHSIVTFKLKRNFTSKIIYWHQHSNKRIMPWKEEKDPYKIWLSEIILQQTRVQQGLSYYNKFVQSFPLITNLANAVNEDVFKLWEGLGYYSRCKNLLATARVIAQDYGGIFPATYNEILRLKGIGPYTAAAIASFAFGLPHAVVDGNVTRVLSRYFGIDTAIDSSAGKHLFNNLARELLYKKNPAAYNQAIMDFGATVCVPKNPGCGLCILNNSCKAYKSDMVKLLPVKEKKLVIKRRWFYYFIFNYKDEVLVRQRQLSDVWQNLHEFYLFEAEMAVEWDEAAVHTWLTKNLQIQKVSLLNISPVYKQQLTHQQIKGQFITISLKTLPTALAGFKKVKISELRNLAFPRFITTYLDANGIIAV